ncbi:MAG: hypothetical protein PHF55_01890 [Bacteroidales bacterium]|nr:hypothetical protein [Bacteroidales bacterium]
MKKSILIIIIISFSILASGQTGKFSGGLLFSPEMNFYEAENNDKKASINYRYGLIGEFKINDYIYIQSGISHIKQTYNIMRAYKHCAFLEPGEFCLEILRYINKTEYYLISVPLNIKFVKLLGDNKISPFVSLNINNNFHLLSKYYSDYDSNVDELKEVKYFGNTGNIGFGIEYLLWSKIKMNLSTHIRIIEYRKKDPIVYEKEDQINTFNNVGLSISILYVL